MEKPRFFIVINYDRMVHCETHALQKLHTAREQIRQGTYLLHRNSISIYKKGNNTYKNFLSGGL